MSEEKSTQDWDEDDFVQADWDEHEEASGRSHAPAGTYLMKLETVQTKDKEGEKRRTGDGALMWSIGLRIVRDEEDDDEYAGTYVWDNLVFSKKGWSRAKLIAKSFGLDVSMSAKLTPDALLNKYAWVEVVVKEQSQGENKGAKRNEVTFAGYSPYEGEEPDDVPEFPPSEDGDEDEGF